MTSAIYTGNYGKLLGIFDRIYVINLPDRHDRRREMGRQLARVGLLFDHPDVRLFHAFRPGDAGEFPSIGARGCFLSHLGILQEAARDRLDAVLICEDDLDFTKTAEAHIPRLTEALAANGWSIFYGGYAEPLAHEPADGPLARVPSDVAVRTTHCIGFRGPVIAEAAAYLAAMLERPPGSPHGGPMHVDGAYSWYRQAYPARQTLASVPPIGTQRPSRSNIFEDLAWFDRLSVLAPLVGGLRRLKLALYHRF